MCNSQQEFVHPVWIGSQLSRPFITGLCPSWSAVLPNTFQFNEKLSNESCRWQWIYAPADCRVIQNCNFIRHINPCVNRFRSVYCSQFIYIIFRHLVGIRFGLFVQRFFNILEIRSHRAKQQSNTICMPPHTHSALCTPSVRHLYAYFSPTAAILGSMALCSLFTFNAHTPHTHKHNEYWFWVEPSSSIFVLFSFVFDFVFLFFFLYFGEWKCERRMFNTQPRWRWKRRQIAGTMC